MQYNVKPINVNFCINFENQNRFLNKWCNYCSYKYEQMLHVIWIWTGMASYIVDHGIGNMNFKWIKTEKVGLLLSYIKPICCKNILYKRHRQFGFHFLMLFLKHGKELECFIFFWYLSQIFEDKKNLVYVPYFTVFGILAYDSLGILKSYGIKNDVRYIETSPNIVGDKPRRHF